MNKLKEIINCLNKLEKEGAIRDYEIINYTYETVEFRFTFYINDKIFYSSISRFDTSAINHLAVIMRKSMMDCYYEYLTGLLDI